LIKETVVKVPFRKLKYIHHISDIQIRNLKRHKEYEEVFERTYEEVKKHKDNAVVYIGGDIAHSKTEMSPELVDQLSRLFKNLADICPTILIAGNHDCNLNNRSRMDVLSPIVNNLQHSQLHYLKHSGVYKCADVKFVVWDVWEKEDDYIEAKDIDGKTKIVLFHGTVDKSETDLGFHLPSDVKISKFKGYDLGLLGDIHKRQHLDKKGTISYCGSLVQQNHGEGLSHGYLLWDVAKRKSEYIEIPNDYGYYTIDIDNGKVPDCPDIPKKARLRVRVSNTTPSQLKKAMTMIHSTYGIKEVSVTRTDSLTSQEKVRGQRITVGDVRDADYQYGLIEEYLKTNHFVDSETLLDIKKINKELNTFLPADDVNRGITWDVKKFEFDNMFSYGENNVVDFTKLNGIVGIFAPNASGKSSLLDSLSFCLFDTSSRAYKASNVLNSKKNNFYCKATLEVDGCEYFIERKGKKLRNGHVKVDVDFWTFDDAGEKLSLNGDQRRTTDVNIRKVIGTYEDFIMTALSLQSNSTVFIDKTQKERKDLLAQFMGIGVFDQLYGLAAEEIHDVSSLLKSFKNNNYDTELADIKESLTELRKDSRSLSKEKKENVDDKKEVDKLIISLTKKLKKVDNSALNISELEEEKNRLINELSDADTKVGKLKTLSEQYKVEETELTEKINIYKENEIDKKFAQLEQYTLEKRNNQIEIDKLKIEVQNKLDKINKLGNLEYDSSCSYCMSNPFTLDAMETEKKLNEDKKLADKFVKQSDSLETIINGLAHITKHKEQMDECIQSFSLLTANISKVDSNQKLTKEKKKNLISQLAIIEDKINLYHEQEKDIQYNIGLQKEIDEMENESESLEQTIEELDKKLQSVNGEIKVLETNRRNIMSNIKKVEKLEDKYAAYQYYMDAVKRDGIPYELISKAIPTIEGAVNDILSQIVDFSMILEMDGKNINCYIVYDDDNVWPLELSSGMERFISSLAMRVGLINVSNLPAPNFLAIDEGWGTMDSDNLNSVYNLFQYLKSQFQFTMIVSHIDSMRDAVDTLLEIKKENTFSNVMFD
jgi:DNA repair exonuclease SbcCD ATPase subunit|tara:strand:- start:215 stop:3370 length:3156 start_codon:yes stop_codon:yes gene_type:complete